MWSYLVERVGVNHLPKRPSDVIINLGELNAVFPADVAVYISLLASGNLPRAGERRHAQQVVSIDGDFRAIGKLIVHGDPTSAYADVLGEHMVGRVGAIRLAIDQSGRFGLRL